MFTCLIKNIDTHRRPQSLLIFAVMVGLIGFVCVQVVAEASLEARFTALNLGFMVAASVFAVSVPHVLLPDRQLAVMQLTNQPPSALLRHQLRQWIPIVLSALALSGLLAFYAPGAWATDLSAKAGVWLAQVGMIMGLGLFSFERYATIGAVSQAWQEGRKGQWFRKMMEYNSIPVGVPMGLVPALFATQWIFIVGILCLVLTVYVVSLALWLAWIPGALLTGWALFQVKKAEKIYDRHYYHTNAFYSEIFRSAGGVRASGREPIAYGTVYWVPHRWRSHTWASLLQLDRKLPLGRLIALTHVVLWVLFMQDVDAVRINAYLLLFAIGKNSVIYWLTTPAFGASTFRRAQQSSLGWVVTHFFVNVRWTMPLLLSLLMVAAFSKTFAYTDALFWTALDIGFAFGLAALITYATDFSTKRRFA